MGPARPGRRSRTARTRRGRAAAAAARAPQARCCRCSTRPRTGSPPALAPPAAARPPEIARAAAGDAARCNPARRPSTAQTRRCLPSTGPPRGCSVSGWFWRRAACHRCHRLCQDPACALLRQAARERTARPHPAQGARLQVRAVLVGELLVHLGQVLGLQARVVRQAAQHLVVLLQRLAEAVAINVNKLQQAVQVHKQLLQRRPARAAAWMCLFRCTKSSCSAGCAHGRWLGLFRRTNSSCTAGMRAPAARLARGAAAGAL